MSKNKTENKVLFIDASKEFKKETNNNILEDKNIEAIVEEFRNRTDKEYFSRCVDKKEIEGKFDDDFMFQLTKSEFEDLISKKSTSSWGGRRKQKIS